MSNHCVAAHRSVLREVRDGSETNPQAPSKPRDPAEAAKRLAKLCQQLEDHIDEYKFEPDQTGVSSELVQWFVRSRKRRAEALSEP